MRLYLEGKLSKPLTFFHPVSVWLANPECDFDWEVTEDCVRIDGLHTDAHAKEGEFQSTWRGVELVYIKRDGETTEYVETEDFTLDQLAKLVTEKKLRLVNMDGYMNESVDVIITKLSILDGNDWYDLDEDLIDEIEFIV